MNILEHIRDLSEPWTARTLLRGLLLWEYLEEFHSVFSLFDTELDYLREKIKPYVKQRPVFAGIAILSDDANPHLTVINLGRGSLSALYANDDLQLGDIKHTDSYGLIQLKSKTKQERYIVMSYGGSEDVKHYRAEDAARQAFKDMGYTLQYNGKQMQNLADHAVRNPLSQILNDKDTRFGKPVRKTRFPKIV